eukprot:494299-Pyramimonas_sp.AAC.1
MLFEPVRSNKEVPSMPICIPEGSRYGAPGALCGIFGIHVDDTVGGGRGARWEDAMSKLKQRFPWRKWRHGEGEFTGSWLRQLPD